MGPRRQDRGAPSETEREQYLGDAGETWKKVKIGTKISFGEGLLIGEVVDIVEEGNRLIQFTYEGIFEEILDKLGQMPCRPISPIS